MSPSSHKLSLKYKLQLIQLITNKLEVLDQHIWRTGGKNTAPLRIDCYNNKDSWAVQTTFILKVWKFVMRKHHTRIVCLYNICMCTPNQYTVEWRPLRWKYELFNIGQVQFSQFFLLRSLRQWHSGPKSSNWLPCLREDWYLGFPTPSSIPYYCITVFSHICIKSIKLSMWKKRKPANLWWPICQEISSFNLLNLLGCLIQTILNIYPILCNIDIIKLSIT